MKKKIQIVPSGISLVDEAWGGFYRGGSYLLVGPRKSGRTLLSLQYALECAKQKEVCLYFTSMRPKDLMIQAASIDFDLQYYMNQNLIIVVRVAPPSDLFEVGNPDDFLVEYLNDIVTVVEQYQPNKLVFDELTPFIGFNNLGLLNDVFVHTTEEIEENSITSLYVVGQPATPAAEAIVDTLASTSTGIIYLQKIEDENGSIVDRKMTITPNIGHTEGKFASSYIIEPYKGIITKSAQNLTKRKTNNNVKDSDLRYTSLADIDLPSENYSSYSFYSVDDFNLILNNQIALYKSTGQVFSVLSIKLNPEAERNGVLTMNQLQNAVRLSSDKKDKICLFGNKVVVLIIKEEQTSIKALISRLKSNLPFNDEAHLARILNYISIYSIKVDDSIRNAEDILKQIESNERTEKNKLYF